MTEPATCECAHGGMYENEPDAFTFFSLSPLGKYYLRVHHKGWEIASGKHVLSLSINKTTLSVTRYGVNTWNGWSGLSIEVPSTIFDEIRLSSHFTLVEPGFETLHVSFPPAAQAVQAVLACQASIMGSTKPGQKFAETSPVPASGNWISMADYPLYALEHRQSGRVGYILSVDATGNPTDCNIIASSGVIDLDNATCRILLAKAHFIPARAHDGTAVSDTFQSRIDWILP